MPHRKKQAHHEEAKEQAVTDRQPAPDGETSVSANELEELRERLAKLEAELEESRNERLRTLAEFQNFRRRTQEEKQLFRQLATENLVSSLLPVLDNFERTIQHLEAGVDPARMMEGIRMVEKQLRSVLEAQSVRRIPSVGQPFDPELHEAVAMEPSEEHPDDTVTLEVEAGYKIGDRVIRPAKVKVAKNA